MATVSVYINDNRGGLMQGLTLKSNYKYGSTHLIGSYRYAYLSGTVVKSNGIVTIPGKRGIGWQIAGDMLSRGESGFYQFYLMEKIAWKKFASKKERNRNLPVFIEAQLDDVERVSDYLDMKEMLKYKDDIIAYSMKFYLTRFIKPKFGSGKLRGKQRFEAELRSVLYQLNELTKYISDEELKVYKNQIETAARHSKSYGAKTRKTKRDAAKKRKELRDVKLNMENKKPNKKRKTN